MTSWLARSIADTLQINNDNLNPTEHENDNVFSSSSEEEEYEDDDNGHVSGVRDDLSELTQTLTRQFLGVASFLAPPPPPPLPPVRLIPNQSQPSDQSQPFDQSQPLDQSQTLGQSQPLDESCSGEMDDEDEFEEEEGFCAVGITEEVLAFVMNIAHHPETWLDFPLDDDDDDDEQNALDFDMSDAQQRHVMAVQCLAPRLAALRIELCPAHMSDGYFWKVYFVLLHPRLNKQDAELLSTPQTVAARGIWMKELQNRNKKESDRSPRGIYDVTGSTNKWHESFDHASTRTSIFGPTTYSSTTEPETVKHPIVSTEMQFVDKAVIEEKPLIPYKSNDLGAGPSFKLYSCNFDEDEDDEWLKEDSELEGYNTTAIVVGNDDDVSFSDLEDDDFDCTMPIKSKIVTVDLGTPRKAF